MTCSKRIASNAQIELDFYNAQQHYNCTNLRPFTPIMLSPVLLLLMEVADDVQQAANEGVASCRAAGARTRGLCSKHSTAPLCVGQLLLHLHVLLPEQGEVLLQLGHLLCDSGSEKLTKRNTDNISRCK